MSLSPSPSRDIKPIKKKAFKFKRANLGASSTSAGNDELSFFSRNRENYVGIVEPKEEKKQDIVKKAHKHDDEDGGGDHDGAGSPPKRAKRREDDEDEDSGEEISSTQKRHASTRQKYKHAITLSDSDDPSPPLPSAKNGSKPNSRTRDTSLTPPPVLYAETVYPAPVPRSTNPHKPPPQTNGDDDDVVVVLTSASAAPAPIDEDDEMLAAIERRARERVAAAARATNSPGTLSPPPAPDPVIAILVTSDLENTRPLVVRRRLKQSLKVVRETWCKRQGFSDDEAADVFLTWKGNKVFDHNSCQGIGIGVDELGNLADQEGTRDNQVHLEAMTAEMLAEREREREMRYETEVLEEVEEEVEEVQSMRLTLKSKGYEDFKLKVRPDTKISKIIYAFREARGIGEEHDITLDFDGDSLDPEDTVGDTELEDTFGIDVYIS